MCALNSIMRTCCFLGHREICETDELREKIKNAVERLIMEENIEIFLFGSKSRFNSLCYEVVTELKEKYPHLQRVYVRAEFPVIGEDYREYLLERYEETYFPKQVIGAGRASYVIRNCEMMDRSRFCIFYYDEEHKTQGRKSGTEIAYSYAIRQGKEIYRFP